MKISDYIKKMGLVKICELCNWDLFDIKKHLSRNAEGSDSQFSREMQKFKALFLEKTEIYRNDPKIEEIIRKLKVG